MSSSLFRSEKMSLVQLFIPAEGAPSAISELGELGLVQFRDLNPEVNAFQRAFVTEIRRLDEMERKLRFLAGQIEKADIPVPPVPENAYLTRARTAQEMLELEVSLDSHESRVLQMNNSYESLLHRSLELTEQKHVLQRTAGFFEQAEDRQVDIRRSFDEPNTPLLQSNLNMESGDADAANRVHLDFVAGVISRSRLLTFERVLWRALRGNLYMNHIEIEEPIIDPSTEEAIQKNVFIIFAHGREILAKIRKISESLGATLYSVDSNPDVRHEDSIGVMNRLEDINSVLYNTNQTRRAELIQVAEQLTTWGTIIKKEKSVYHTMNLFNYDVNRKCLIAEGWCPTISIGVVQNALRLSTEHVNSMAPAIVTEQSTTKEPPTYHRTNKFTQGFQDIVDSYGVAKYGEVNPGLFTIISFPFLFGVMFGDLGHGFIMAATAAYVCLNERKLAKVDGGEFFSTFFNGRYIILLMGLFSMYTGFIYNDIFSRSMDIWHSGWVWPEVHGNETVEATQVGVYPIGIDPAWHGSDNALLFTNSYKMKMSILFGVIQMSFGIVLTVYNYRHFKKPLSIWTDFLPQILFMHSIFGYLALCIVYKWSVDWYAKDADGNNIYGTPPGLLNMLIYMFLQPGTVSEDEQLYPGQGPVQLLLLLIALVCIPWMLLTRPLILKAEHDRIRNAGYGTVATVAPRVSEDAAEAPGNSAGDAVSPAEEMEQEEEFDFGEIMVHQSIHTIEFCLSCISNTASYLRLWALSLAHAQLSTVLWDMTLEPSFHMSPSIMPFMLFVSFALWFTLSVGILIVMEGLSAFLHALRLHWVEFNSKFYDGSGKKFLPFSFQAILEDEVQE